MAREAMNMQFALLGASGVGKTSLFKKYFGEINRHPTITIDPVSERKRMIVKHLGQNVVVNLCVWDTAGMEKYQSLMPQYYRSTHGFIVVYDVTSRDTFEALNRVFDDAETFATIEDHVKILVGNKIDQRGELNNGISICAITVLNQKNPIISGKHKNDIYHSQFMIVKERVVSRAEGLKFAHSRGSLFIEASAVNNEAVDHIFEKLVVKVLADCNLWRNTTREIVRLQDTPPANSGWRCWCWS